MIFQKPYILAISSFAVHGTASLKTFITFLGERILPVPSLLLNGLTNMNLVRKFEPPFEELLRSTFQLASNRQMELILYVGYLGDGRQTGIILNMIDTYRALIKIVLVDPVCGDHGRTYVNADIIRHWPNLIRQSDMVFPNLTELKILTGHKPDDNQAIEVYLNVFKHLFPETQLVVTSVRSENSIGIKADGKYSFTYYQPELPKNYGGSGDAFLSLFILNHFYNKLSFNQSLKKAAEQTYSIIKNSIEQNSDDLILQNFSVDTEYE